MPEPLPRQQIWHLTGRRLGAYRFAYDDTGVASLDELHADGWAPIVFSNLGGGPGPTGPQGATGAGGLTPTVDVKTADYTATANQLVYTDSTDGSFTVTLPAAPPNGTKVGVMDTSASWPTFPVLLAPGAGDTVLEVDGLSCDDPGGLAIVQYVNETDDWRLVDNWTVSSGSSAGTDEFPSVKDYGAVGDGSSCLAAFQAALAAAGAAIVPAGDYQLEATLELTAEQTLLLMPGAEIFPLASGGPYLTHVGDATREVLVKLSGIGSRLEVQGNARLHLRSRTNFAAVWASNYDHLIEGGLVIGNTPGTPIAGQVGVIITGHSSRVLKTRFETMDIGVINYGSGANGCEYSIYCEEGNVGLQIDNGPASNISSVHINNCIFNLQDVNGVRIYSRSRDLLGVSIAQTHFEGLVAGQNLIRILPGTGAGGYVALGVTSSIFLNQVASSGAGIKIEDGCDATVIDNDFGSLAAGINSISSYHLTAHGNRFAANVTTPIIWPGPVHRIDRGDPYGSAAGGLAPTADVKTASYAATVGQLVYTDSSAGAFTVTLPSSPPNGAQVALLDAAGSWATNPVLVAPGAGSSVLDGTGLSCDGLPGYVALRYVLPLGDWQLVSGV